MNQRRTENAMRGFINRAHGKQFEEEIKTTLDFYKRVRLAAVDKTPEPMRVLQRAAGGKFLACFESKAQPDFKGTLRGGSSVVFEAKYTDNASIKQDAVTDAQTDALNLHAALGAKCYVIVSFGAGNFYRIPWGVWRNMKKIYGHKYINIAEVEQYRVIMRDGIADFLGLIQG